MAPVDRFTKSRKSSRWPSSRVTAILVLVGAVTRTAGYPLIWAIDIAQISFVWACVLGADIALSATPISKSTSWCARFSRAVRRMLAIVFLVMISVFPGDAGLSRHRADAVNLERPLGDVGISYGCGHVGDSGRRIPDAR